VTDPLQRLEAELSRMRPQPLGGSVRERIETDLAGCSPWPDRFLLSAIGSGALAACVIVAILLGDLRTSSPVAAEQTKQVNSDAPRLGDSILAIARADAPWDTTWK
jgi:hypothetical protein